MRRKTKTLVELGGEVDQKGEGRCHLCDCQHFIRSKVTGKFFCRSCRSLRMSQKPIKAPGS